MSEVEYEINDGVAVLTLQRGAANALSPDMRAELMAALSRATDDTGARAIVLTGAGDVFCSGVDLAEFDGPLAQPWVTDLTQAIEACAKPVVAALHGAALGAGFELALAAHGRVAQAGSRVALPEVSLGLVPVGGSTQRLPRLVGAQAALELLLSGKAIPVEDKRLAPVFQAITEEMPLERALQLAREMAQTAERGAGPLRIQDVVRGFSDPEGYQRAITSVQGRLTSRDGAEAQIVRCVEAAQLLPYEQGLRFEASVFEDRVGSEAARAIRHVYAAERRAAMVSAGAASEVKTVVVAGRDELATELAIFCLDRGRRVAILGPDEDTAEDLSARVRAIYDGAVARDRLKAEARDQRLERLSQSDERAVLTAADMVLDTGGVDLEGVTLKPGAIWVPLEGRAQAGGHETAVMLRPYRPVHSVPLVEAAAVQPEAAEALATVTGFFSANGRTVLHTVPQAGLLGDRVMGAGLRAALVLVRAGADPMQVDAAAKALGFARGPFEMIETETLARAETRLRRIFGPVPELDLLLARGQAMVRGETPGQGFYAIEGQALAPDPTLEKWLRDWRWAQTDLPKLPEIDLGVAFHAALVRASAELIAAKAVQRASDIDLCFVKGHGFERARGGPLLQADLRGLLGLVRGMAALAPIDEDLWGPHPMLDEMVKFGQVFFPAR